MKSPIMKLKPAGMSVMAVALSLNIGLPGLCGAEQAYPGTGAGNRLGAKMGFNLTNQIYASEEEMVGDKSYGLGMSLGIFATFVVNKDWAIQSELLYVKKGAEYSFGGASFKSSYDYLEIPILAKYTIRAHEKFTPNVYAGPTGGFLVGARWKDDSASMDIAPQSEAAEFGLAAGIGWGFAIDGHDVTVDIRYTRGLSRVNQAGTSDPKPGAIYNSTIGFAAGYLF